MQSYSTTTYLVYRQERRRGGGGQEAVRSRTAQEMSQSSHTNRRVIRTVQSYVDHSGNGPGTTSSKYGYVQDKKVIVPGAEMIGGFSNPVFSGLAYELCRRKILFVSLCIIFYVSPSARVYVIETS